ncbi:PP2C family serine/threonine-protein phosphatase [Liberiplasma polymorphum]|uniref:PP2C family serine/threonine-protein phosphatase n=1 Tax=Liberiplasma polymorphum TaxID=3374570 RepID=UPI003774253A
MLVNAYGASIKGEFHKKNKLPNQDAYLIHKHKQYTLVVVCDGLGSKKHSKRGSKKLSKAFKKEVKRFYNQQKFDFSFLIKNVAKRWERSLFPFKARDSDTTCLFALISSKNILMAQIGDGLIVFKSKNGAVIIKEDSNDFTNETQTFNKSSINQWTVKSIKPNAYEDLSLLLCTDGIGNDLKIEHLDDFIGDLVQTIQTKETNQNKTLVKIISNWPNKFSTDDKTIVVVNING